MTASTLSHRSIHSLLAAISLMAMTTSVAFACDRDTDCRVGDRSYRISLPIAQSGDAPIGAIIFLHGYRGTAAGVMDNKALKAAASNLGVALIAAQAAGVEWNVPGVPSVDAAPGVDELDYFDALVDDVTQRFAVDRSRLMVSGFSSGAMMVWHLACYRGTSFAGFAPMSGTFWKPLPEHCPTAPVNLIHYHGSEDPVVPLAGRPIKDAHQGNVRAAIELMSRTGDYRPVEIEYPPALRCSTWMDHDSKRLELCLFLGKHELKVEHIVRAWREFELIKHE